MPDQLTSEGLEQFSDVARSHIGHDKVPGMVALVACGDHVHAEAFGSLTIDGPPVRRDSLFRMSSTTKPIAAAATLALVSEGLLSVNEPVDRLLPELSDRRVLKRMDGSLDDTVEANRAITVRDLLTFTFGFGMLMDMFMAPEPWPVVSAAAELHLATLGPPDPAEQPDPDTWIAAELGVRPISRHRGTERRILRLGRRSRDVVAGRPRSRSHRDRVDAAHVRRPRDPARAPRASGSGLFGLQVVERYLQGSSRSTC